MVRSGRTHERLIALFLLGVLLLLPPILLVFNRPVRVLGVPLLYIYVFAAWMLLIALAAAITRQIAPDDAGERKVSGAAADERQAPVVRARDA